MAVDAERLQNLPMMTTYIWSQPFTIIIALFFLWQELGVAVLGGLGVVLLIIPINGYLTSVSKRMQTKQMKLKDERVKQMNEMLSGMKVLKLYAWENAFMANILDIRNKEI